MKVAALIPAKANSERCPGKNQRELAGKPLFVWSILQAQACPSISTVYVSSDDGGEEGILDVAFGMGCHPMPRLEAHAGPLSPDIDWIQDLLPIIDPEVQVFVLLRPTSPFRTPQTIEAALSFFLSQPKATSLRAVRKVKEHPAKQWVHWADAGGEDWLDPLAGWGSQDYPWAGLSAEPWSQPYQALPTVYVQDSSLEIAHRATYEAGSLTGSRVLGWENPWPESLAIDTGLDWDQAESISLLENPFKWAGEATKPPTRRRGAPSQDSGEP